MTVETRDPPVLAPTMSVWTSFDEAAPHRDEWNAFAVSVGAPVFLSFETCSVWWSHYGRGRTLHILVFRSGDELVGLLPMFVEKRRLGPVALRVAGLVGSDSTPVVQHLPVRLPAARAVFAAALAHLLGPVRCDAVRLAPLAGADEHLPALREAVGDAASFRALLHERVVGPCTYFHLPGTFDQHLASLRKSHRAAFKRGVKILREEHDVRIDAVTDPAALEEEYPKFLRLHEEQWRSEGMPGHFGDWPRSVEYHRDLLRAHAPHGRAILARLLLDGTPVSYHLCYAFGDTLHWFLPARAVRPDLEKHSIGRLSLLQLLEHAIQARFRRVEGGVGHYDYKLQLGGTELPVRSVLITSDRTSCALRLRAFRGLADALDLVYYRGWFQRIAPKMPFPRGTLWPLWIRSRL